MKKFQCKKYRGVKNIMSKIYNWSENINENELDNCIEVLRNEGIVIFPTETVYGIGANAYCEKSVKKYMKLKKDLKKNR